MRKKKQSRLSPNKSSLSSTNSKKPIFSFSKMRDNTGYSVSCCDDANCAALTKQLYKLSRLTWQEIQNTQRHGLGHEIIPLSSIQQEAIRSAFPEDSTPIAFRYKGKAPMIGYRTDQVFHIICLDHDFTVYQH